MSPWHVQETAAHTVNCSSTCYAQLSGATASSVFACAGLGVFGMFYACLPSAPEATVMHLEAHESSAETPFGGAAMHTYADSLRYIANAPLKYVPLIHTAIAQAY
jgi:hypothetical protein